MAQVLLVLLILFVVAAIFFPVYTNGHRRPIWIAGLSNNKQMALAVMMYSADYDDRLPLGHGLNAKGEHGYNYYKYTPHDWSSDSRLDRVEISRPFVMNSLMLYTKNSQLMASPGQDEFVLYAKEGVRPDRRQYSTTYAYNGYLHALEQKEIVSPENIPLFTSANGNRVGVGIGFANPALDCATAYAPCYYRPRTGEGCVALNGGTGAMYTKYDGAESSYWLYKRGQNWAFSDGHAKFRQFGSTFTPNHTDWRIDPWTGYNRDGHAGTYWSNGCHAWLFRPDFSFED